MLAVKGYFDGHNYITEGNIAARPNQKVIITFLDEDFDMPQTDDETSPSPQLADAMLEALQISGDPTVKGYSSTKELFEDLNA